METSKTWCTPRFNPGPLLFLVYINDFPRSIDNCAEAVLFADDTNIVIANANVQEYKHNTKITIQEINDWFCGNSLTINYNNCSLLTIFYKKKRYHFK